MFIEEYCMNILKSKESKVNECCQSTHSFLSCTAINEYSIFRLQYIPVQYCQVSVFMQNSSLYLCILAKKQNLNFK